jgi:hypothetical protein
MFVIRSALTALTDRIRPAAWCTARISGHAVDLTVGRILPDPKKIEPKGHAPSSGELS